MIGLATAKYIVIGCLLILTLPIQATGQEDNNRPAKTSIILSQKMINRFHNWLRNPSTTDFESVSHYLDYLHREASSDYNSYDYFLYASGLLAQANQRIDETLKYYSAYIRRRSSDDAFAPFPQQITAHESLNLLRAQVVKLQETILKKWQEDRWAVHLCQPNQKGYEYQNVVASIALTDITQDALDAIMLTPPTGYSESANARVFKDYAVFWVALNLRRSQKIPDMRAAIAFLRESDSPWPVPTDLLDRIEYPPKLVLGIIRLRALIVFSLIVFFAMVAKIFSKRIARKRSLFDSISRLERTSIVAVVILLVSIALLFITQHPLVLGLEAIALLGTIVLFFLKWSRYSNSNSQLSAEYQLHINDPFGYICVKRWRGSLAAIFFLSILIPGVTLSLMAWSEDTLWRDSIVVNRSFLDHLSFPFSFGLLVPTYFLFSAIFYVWGGHIVNRVINIITSENPERLEKVKTHWKKYHAVLISRRIVIVFATTIILVMLGLEVQWTNDPGTAFIDPWYPGHLSLTGVYYAFIWGFVLYAMATIIFRYSCVLFFLASVFRRKHQKEWQFEPDYNINHPDNCCGLRPIGNFILRFYILMALLATGIVLILVERLRFLGSLDVALQVGYISVGLYSMVFILLAPVLVAYPIISMHLALRRYRFNKVKNLSELIAAQETKLFEKVHKDAYSEEDREAWNWLTSIREQYLTMRLWPIDIRTMMYFLATNLIPVASFFLPLAAKKLGIDL